MWAFRLFAVFAYYKQERLSNFFVKFCLHLCRVSCSWQRTQEDLQQLRSEFDAVSTKCNSFLHQSPSGSSVPTLRSELNLLVEKMDHVYGLSTVYLNKLKTIDVIVRSIQDAELLVKGYEIKLSQEEAVPADLSALESHRSTLRVGCSEFLSFVGAWFNISIALG